MPTKATATLEINRIDDTKVVFTADMPFEPGRFSAGAIILTTDWREMGSPTTLKMTLEAV